MHVSGVVAATLERKPSELRVRRLPGGSDAVVEFVAGLSGSVRATYEAGPSGFVLARKMAAIGVECLVCAPGLIDTLTAAGLCADRRLHRYEHPAQVMSYLGVVPQSTPPASGAGAGRSRSRKPTRAPLARRSGLAVPSSAPRGRQSRAPPTQRRTEILAQSWKAQRRLHHVWNRMEQRNKRRTIIAIAAARELAGFCWAVATAD